VDWASTPQILLARRAGVHRFLSNCTQIDEEPFFCHDRDHGQADPDYYRSAILPKPATVALRDLMLVTGMSKTTCSRIRRGLKVPHPRHWEGLNGLPTAIAKERDNV
jgi:hypothetical protein